MLIKADKNDETQILDYLWNDVSNCLYLYMDILNYGIGSGKLQVFLSDRNDEAGPVVVMKYYDSFQIYKRDGHLDRNELEDFSRLLLQNSVKMISGPRTVIQQLEVLDGYKSTYGVIYLMDRFRKASDYSLVKRAVEEDARDIAVLICKDSEIGGHYDIDGLEAQLRDRIQSETGRSYIIRKDGKIVAHTATYAETDDLAVVGGTIIAEEYRNSGYYMILSNYITGVLNGEGKSVYTFSISDKMIKFHEKMHTRCGEYGKLEALPL